MWGVSGYFWSGSYPERGVKITSYFHERQIETIYFAGREHNFTIERYFQQSCSPTGDPKSIFCGSGFPRFRDSAIPAFRVAQGRPSPTLTNGWISITPKHSFRHLHARHRDDGVKETCSPGNTVLICIELSTQQFEFAKQSSFDFRKNFSVPDNAVVIGYELTVQKFWICPAR